MCQTDSFSDSMLGSFQECTHSINADTVRAVIPLLLGHTHARLVICTAGQPQRETAAAMPFWGYCYGHTSLTLAS